MNIREAIKNARTSVKRILLGTKALMAADKADDKKARARQGLRVIMPILKDALDQAEAAVRDEAYKDARKWLDSVKKNEAVLVENFKEVLFYSREVEKNLNKARQLGAIRADAAVELREQTNG